MKPREFLADLEQTPSSLLTLRSLLLRVDPWASTLTSTPRRIVLLGMGSSHFANSVLAMRLQALGIPAYAALASADPLPSVNRDDVVIVVSASGGSAETLDAARNYAGRCRTIALTNTSDSKIEEVCDSRVDMHAGVELGGVSCRSFQHTLALHLALIDHLTGSSNAGAVLDRAGAATTDLLEREHQWLPQVSELLLGPEGTAIVAPGRRLSSALQGALMLREGPRLPAVGCETGDWSHIDVYLTKTTDYRMLLLAGSVWEPQLWEWTTQRGSTVVIAGADSEHAAMSLRYAHDDEDEVRLLAEVMIPSLVAARVWAGQG